MGGRRKKFSKDGYIEYLEISNQAKRITCRDYVGTVKPLGSLKIFKYRIRMGPTSVIKVPAYQS